MLQIRSARTLALLPVAATLLAAAAPSRAQDSQYWDIQYGPIGQLLGGQVVGSTRDPSATYYNPGGLALVENPEFLLSVQAFSMRTFCVKPVSGGPLLDTSQTDLDAFPGCVALTFPGMPVDTHVWCWVFMVGDLFASR
jgi:hypothetical protein